MRVCRLLRLGLRWELGSGIVVGVVVGGLVAAHGMQIGGFAASALELAPPQVDRVPNATRTRLDQVRMLVANKSWGEAIDLLISLSTDSASGLVDLGDGGFTSLASYCQREISHMPVDALAEYRRRVDAVAADLFHSGVSARDERLLRHVVDEYYCSSWGDDALRALGELALEKADYSDARRWWEQISPLLRDPSGRPLWLALRGIDLNAHWPQVEQRWNERSQPPTWLAYPDTGFNLAQLRAWLVVTSLRAGEWERATIELEAYRRWHPQAAGPLGGQTGNYVAALDRLYATAQDWPAEPQSVDWTTFAGSPSRSPRAAPIGPLDGPLWAVPVPFSPPAVSSSATQAGEWLAGDLDRDTPPPIRESQLPLSCFPVSVHGLVAFGDGTQIAAVELETGQPAITNDGRLYREEAARAVNGIDGFGIGRHADLPFMNIEPSVVPRHTLTVAGNVLYGRVGRATTAATDSSRENTSERLIGLDLQRDGQLTFRARPGRGDGSFDGVPIGDGRRVFVAMREGTVSPRVHVVCFDGATGNELWQTYLGMADTPAGMPTSSHTLLTLAGNRIYCNTNLGLVAALETDDGRVCWVRRYARRAAQPGVGGRAEPLHFRRDPAPCVYQGGLLMVAPADTPDVFCLDAETGQILWSNDRFPDAMHLLGVVGDNLVVSGNRLAALDVGTGELQFNWPESETAGIRGMGRGIIAGDEVFWPTRSEIYVVDGASGAQRRPPIRIGEISNCGANLAAARGRLIVAGYDKIMVWGPASIMPAPRTGPERTAVPPTAVSTAATGNSKSQFVSDRPMQ